MDFRNRSASRAASAALPDTELLRSGSILIYCRSSFTLTLLVFAALLAKLYSDLYVHMIRQVGRSLARAEAPPAALLSAMLAGTIFLALRAKPRVERVTLLLLAANLGAFLLRQKAHVGSDAYQILCALSLLLDLALLSLVVVFYRTYPNLLKVLRCADLPPGPSPARRVRKAS